jgi:hypothetical protein
MFSAFGDHNGDADYDDEDMYDKTEMVADMDKVVKDPESQGLNMQPLDFIAKSRKEMKMQFLGWSAKYSLNVKTSSDLSKVSKTWRRRNNKILKNNTKALADPKVAKLTHNHFSGMTEE